jgi:hypothetical protein
VLKALLNRAFDFAHVPLLKPFERNLGSGLRICRGIFEDTERFRVRGILAGGFHDDPGLGLIVYDGLNDFSFVW